MDLYVGEFLVQNKYCCVANSILRMNEIDDTDCSPIDYETAKIVETYHVARAGWPVGPRVD